MEYNIVTFVLSVMASIIANVVCSVVGKRLDRKKSHGDQPNQ